MSTISMFATGVAVLIVLLFVYAAGSKDCLQEVRRRCRTYLINQTDHKTFYVVKKALEDMEVYSVDKDK